MKFNNERVEKLVDRIDEINKEVDALSRDLENRFSETKATPKSADNPQLVAPIDDDSKVQEALDNAGGHDESLLLLLKRGQRLLKKAIWLQETALKALSLQYADTGKSGPIAIVMGPRKPPQDPD